METPSNPDNKETHDEEPKEISVKEQAQHSLLKVLFIAVVLGFIPVYWSVWAAVCVFFGAIFGQIIGWNLYRLYMITLQSRESEIQASRMKMQNEKKLEMALEEFRKKPYKPYNLELNCPACKQVILVEFQLENSEFKCSKCGNENVIYTSFMVAQKTDTDFKIKSNSI